MLQQKVYYILSRADADVELIAWILLKKYIDGALKYLKTSKNILPLIMSALKTTN